MIRFIQRRRVRPLGSLSRALRRRAGVSVIEAMVALTLFGTTAIGIAGMSLTVAKRGDANDLVTKRTALLQQNMNWLQSIPYDSLPAKAGSFTVSKGAFPYSRTIFVTTTGNRRTITVQITPKKSHGKVESITFDRARPTASPLCKGC